MKKRPKPPSAKSNKPQEKSDKPTIKTPSEFGSHASMVVETYDTTRFQPNENEVVCQDNHGFYLTLKVRLDTGLADPNRYNSKP